MHTNTFFFRFATAIAVVTAVGLVSIALEKQILSLKRSISLEHYRTSHLQEEQAQLQLRVARLKRPDHLLQQLVHGLPPEAKRNQESGIRN